MSAVFPRCRNVIYDDDVDIADGRILSGIRMEYLA
jgi:hypothetical protein